MNEDDGRSQTTKGIWLARNTDGKILVFDIEGTDSKERGEQRMTFEQTTSLFALAIADVLLINMWTTDIGRHGASNYGLLQVIFEVNLKLFEQQSSKKLLFVLRDFDDRKGNFERIKAILDNDINNIWEKIYKPAHLSNSKATDFFQFEFACMPHKNFQEDQFLAKAKELRNRFAVGATDSLFLSEAEQKNLPIDGMPIFVDQAWESIRNQKELNLPDQRAMVANYRCNEIKEEAIKSIANDIQKLEAACAAGVVPEFGSKCTGILKKATDYFSDVSKQYTKDVREKVLQELIE